MNKKDDGVGNFEEMVAGKSLEEIVAEKVKSIEEVESARLETLSEDELAAEMSEEGVKAKIESFSEEEKTESRAILAKVKALNTVMAELKSPRAEAVAEMGIVEMFEEVESARLETLSEDELAAEMSEEGVKAKIESFSEEEKTESRAILAKVKALNTVMAELKSTRVELKSTRAVAVAKLSRLASRTRGGGPG